MSRAHFALGVPAALAASVVRFRMLRRASPRPFGLATVIPTMPRMLESEGWGPGLTDIVLAYGYPFDVSRPLIEVATCFAEEHCYLPSLEQALARAEYRDDAWYRGDVEESAGVFSPPAWPQQEVRIRGAGFAHRERTVNIEGDLRTVPVMSLRRYEALRFRHGRMVVTAIARLGFPDALSFRVVGDLEPYFAGHRRFVLSWLRFWQA